MPAAPLRDRRVSSRGRTSTSAERVRPRAPRVAPPPASKLVAARRSGLNLPAIGLAGGLAVVLVAAAILATGGRGQDVAAAARQVLAGAQVVGAQVQGLYKGQFASLGLRVGAVRLQGATKSSQDEILQAAAIPQGAPILGLDLNAVRARVEKVGWVEHARVIRLLPDTLVVAVDERPIAAVWQHHGRRDVVAADGHVIGQVDPSAFTGLPVLVGEGANTDAADLLPQIQSRPRLVSHLAALRRVDGRRWDLVLKDGMVVLLPADDVAGGLARLDRLDARAHVLDLGLARLDLRDADFIVVRSRQAAAPTTDNKTHGA